MKNNQGDKEAEVHRLQAKLATRLLLITIIPLSIITFLGIHAYNLKSRVEQLEGTDRINRVERTWQRTQNIDLAILEYEKIVQEYENLKLSSVDLLTRLGGLYYKRATQQPPTFPDDIDWLVSERSINIKQTDEKEALKKLREAKKIATQQNEDGAWITNATLASLYLDQAMRLKNKGETEPAEKLWGKAIEEGEQALQGSKGLDAETLNNLAWIYATVDGKIRNLGKAEEYAKKAVLLTRGQDPDIVDTLAEVYRQKGQTALAMKLDEMQKGVN